MGEGEEKTWLADPSRRSSSGSLCHQKKFFVYFGSGGEDGVGLDGVLACDVGGEASGFLDDGGDGGDVPDGDGGFDDGVYSACGEEDEGVAIGEASCVFGGGVYFFIQGAEFWGVEVGEGGGADEGLVEFVYCADFGGDWVVVVGLVVAAEACGGVDEFV